GHVVPPSMTMLYGVEVPPNGGDTEFANTRLGYAALPVETKRRIAGWRVVFCWGVSGGKSVAAVRDDPPVDHPLVRTHPDTGQKELDLGNHGSPLLGIATPGALAEQRAITRNLPTLCYPAPDNRRSIECGSCLPVILLKICAPYHTIAILSILRLEGRRRPQASRDRFFNRRRLLGPRHRA